MTAEINSNLVYFLGIARCFLSEAKIICIYDIPEDLNENEKELFIDIIKKIQKSCTVLIFTKNLKFSNVSTNVIELEY